ncbi:MAG TPA: mechanosensitive ion channel family protein [Lacibacter sp.]|nr:mechanosensitive ion channel family protein [Lacibacter sp.]
MNEVLLYEWWGNTVKDYLMISCIVLITVLLYRRINKLLLLAIRKLTGKTETIIDDLLTDAAERFLLPWLYFVVLYRIILRLHLHSDVKSVLAAAISFITLYYAVRFINFLITQSVTVYMRSKDEPKERIRQLNGVLTVIKGIVWITGILLLASNLGYNITTIIAGLGVGGIAVALAAQNILGDLFSYLVIFFDKPFETGDFIMGSGYSGIVERIGIKTTHIRSLEGQQLIVPNAEMSKTVIQNFKRLNRRRIVFSVGIVYKTSVVQLRKIPELIKTVICEQELVSFDRVHLKNFGDFSIQFETVYYVESADMIVYVNAHHAICMRLFEVLTNEHIEFAFPTQTIYLEQTEKATASQAL